MKKIVKYIMLEDLYRVIEDQVNYASDILEQPISLPPETATLSFLSKLYLSLLEERNYEDLIGAYINTVLACTYGDNNTEPSNEKIKIFNALKNILNLYPPYMKHAIDSISFLENPDKINTLKVELNKYVI